MKSKNNKFSIGEQTTARSLFLSCDKETSQFFLFINNLVPTNSKMNLCFTIYEQEYEEKDFLRKSY